MLKQIVKPFELAGRYVLEALLGVLLMSRRRAPTQLPAAAKILVVRLDQRVGNLLLVTPLLASLKQSFPLSHITLLCSDKTARVVAHNPFVETRELYVKWALFSQRGPFALIARLRRAKFDVAIDAGSYDTASITHPVLTRLAGARATIGMDRPRIGLVYSQRVALPTEIEHEIRTRLRLLDGLAAVSKRVTEMTYASATRLQQLHRDHAAFLVEAAPHGASNTLVLVVGGRLAERQLSLSEWSAIAADAIARGRAVTLVFGPGEREQAQQIQRVVHAAHLAPDSTLDQLAVLAKSARGVVGHDTGTSHLSVAVRARTCVVFVATDPRRYGHTSEGCAIIDLRAVGNAARAKTLRDAITAWDR